jgi:hypothetical protein
MKTYYRMTTAQKDAVPREDFDCLPYSNIVGDEWIAECNASGLESIIEYSNAEECREYINTNNSEWDEFYEI